MICIATLLAMPPLLKSADATDDALDRTISKGRYLATGVAMCVDCHSPKQSNGLIAPGKLLMGTEVYISPVVPVADWVSYAPAISGLPTYSDAEVVEVLTTGTIGNTYLRPPMPVFQMNVEDAEAIVAYLRSLPLPDSP